MSAAVGVTSSSILLQDHHDSASSSHTRHNQHILPGIGVSVNAQGAGACDSRWSPCSCCVVEALRAVVEMKTSDEARESPQNQMKYMANPAVSQNWERLQTAACSAVLSSCIRNLSSVIQIFGLQSWLRSTNRHHPQGSQMLSSSWHSLQEQEEAMMMSGCWENSGWYPMRKHGCWMLEEVCGHVDKEVVTTLMNPEIVLT